MKHHQVHPTQPSPSLSQSFQLMHSCHLTVFDTVCLLAAHLLEVGRLTGCALALPPSLGFLWRVRKRDITVFSRRFPWQQELWIQPRPPHPPPCRVAPISDAGLPASAADAPCVLGNWHSILLGFSNELCRMHLRIVFLRDWEAFIYRLPKLICEGCPCGHSMSCSWGRGC